MDQGLKERLVGAAVLVAIAVWLVPWVLDGPDGGLEPSVSSLELPAAEEPMPIRTQTLRLGDAQEAAAPPAASSPAPDVEAAKESAAPQTQPRTEPAAETTVAALAPTPAAPVPQPARTAPPPKPTASAPAAAAAGDWTVQLGSFGEEGNARRLAQSAGTYGYKAEVSSVRGSNGKTLYRVRVGPQATRAAADAAASALRAHGIKDARVVAAR